MIKRVITMKNGNYCTLLGQGTEEIGRNDIFLIHLFFFSHPFPLPYWKYLSIQWRNCSSMASTKIIPVISTDVSIILFNIHPTLLTVDMFHVVLLLLPSLYCLVFVLCMIYHMLQMMKLWCENDDVITVCKWCYMDLWTMKNKTKTPSINTGIKAPVHQLFPIPYHYKTAQFSPVFLKYSQLLWPLLILSTRQNFQRK